MPNSATWLAVAFAALALNVIPAEAAPPNKCILKGAVTYQQEPCPSGQPRQPRPSLQELNAEEQRRRAAAASAPPSWTAPAAEVPAMEAPVATAKPGTQRCDGRRYCSQMTSCTEARYFLAHCPGVQMDGDGNGIPCEKQWCAR